MPMRLRANSLAAVSLITVLAAAPALAEDVTVNNITAGDGYQVSVPSVTATGTTLTEAQIRRLFTGDFSSVAGALADLDAKQVSIPEISVTYDVPAMEDQPAQKAIVIYRDFELNDVVDGVARTVSVGNSTVQSGDVMTMNIGPMSAENFDIGALLAFYGVGGPAASDAFKTVYSNFAFDGATVSGAANFSCDIGGASLERFEARPLKTDMMAFTKLAMETEGKKDVPPETIRKLVDFYVDILTAFRSTPTLAEGFNCSGKDDKGNAFAASAGGMQVGGFEPGKYPHFSVDDLKISAEGDQAGTIALGNFTWKQMDFNGPIEALKAAATLDEAWFEANWRRLIPSIDGLSLADLSVDVPNPEGGDRIQASLGAFDVSLADYVNGLPSDISLSTDNLVIDVPNAEEGKLLRALGVTQLDLSEDIKLHWNKSDNTIIVDSIALGDEKLGSMKISGILGNATDQLFSDDNNVAMVAAMGLTLKEITLDLDDRGLSTLLIGVSAAEQGQDPNVMRVGMAGLAQAMVLGIVGTTPEAMAASEEVAKFVKANPQLTLTLRSTAEGGIALPLLMAATDNPAVLAGQLSITAAATGDARPADQPIALPQGGMMSDDDMMEQMQSDEGDDDAAATPDDGAMSDTQTNKKSLKN